MRLNSSAFTCRTCLVPFLEPRRVHAHPGASHTPRRVSHGRISFSSVRYSSQFRASSYASHTPHQSWPCQEKHSQYTVD